MKPGELLMPGGATLFGKRFLALLEALKLANLPYTPGCLRPAGVVADFISGQANLTELMFHGRWESLRSLTRYLQAGMADFTIAVISEEQLCVCEQLETLLPDLCHA
jgi:hypothetical protein